MKLKAFDMSRYGKAIEKMVSEWYSYSREILDQSSDLGSVREHFIKNILDNFLPKGIIVGSGEIVDGRGLRSGQQDIILYRADFPIITSFTPINTYFAEGVVATIEVKSDLSTSSPNHLHKSFQNSSKVIELEKQAYVIHGNEDEISKLQNATSIKTYVIGYQGWKEEKTLMEQFKSAAIDTQFRIPDLVCLPGFCIFRNDGFITGTPMNQNNLGTLLVHQENPYAVFLHHILKHVMINTAAASVKAFGIDAAMHYNLDPYFNFNPPLRANIYSISRANEG